MPSTVEAVFEVSSTLGGTLRIHSGRGEAAAGPTHSGEGALVNDGAPLKSSQIFFQCNLVIINFVKTFDKFLMTSLFSGTAQLGLLKEYSDSSERKG